VPPDLDVGNRRREAAPSLAPAPSPTDLPRHRLLELLSRDPVPVTLVCGPAGSGKTSLLATWAATRGEEVVAWLGLERHDDDPHHLWTSVLRSLRSTGAFEADAHIHDLAAPPGTVTPSFIDAVVAELSTLGRSVCLVIDDVHVLRQTAAADDHYHRYVEDVGLMADLGTNAYRFSIAWPRIFPGGTGALNPKGLDFYDRLVDTLLEAGIEPFATLYHWDLPQPLQDRGGWEDRSTAHAFAEYAGAIADKLGDRIRHFFTLNEFTTFVEGGHGSGLLAPGLVLPAGRLNQVRHHAVLAHGLAVQAIRAAGRDSRVGPAENLTVTAPTAETPEHIRAAELAVREVNAGYLTVMLEGRYTDAFLAACGADAPSFTDEDLAIIGSPLDFVGVNIYFVNHYVRAADSEQGYELLPPAPSHPHAASWHRISPEAMYWGPRLLHSVWDVDEIHITENGCSSKAELTDDGDIHDTDRITFMRSYLAQLQRATEEGIPVRGYFHWSLMDNFEWIAGYSNRYGLVHVDFETQQRTLKDSAGFYREVISRNAVV
jgi:beta-glucosidase